MHGFLRVAALGWAALVICGLAGCGDGGESLILSAVGSYGDVAVLPSSPELFRALETSLEPLNPERTFVLKVEDSYDFQEFGRRTWKDGRNYRNLIFLVLWSDGGPIAKELSDLLGEETEVRLKSGSGGAVTIRDPYFRNQLALVVAANDPNQLRRLLRKSGPELAETLRQDIRRRIIRDHRREGIHAATVKHLWETHGFTLEIPTSYRENQTQPDGFPGIEWLRDDGATRGLTVAWRDAEGGADPLEDREGLTALREDLGRALHGERLVPESLVWSSESLAGLPAVRLDGAWASDEVSVGGPFECYFVSDPAGGRVFCLDLLVYAPDREKMDDFRRLRAMAETFSLNAPPESGS